MPKKIGIIDLGSNSVRLVIFEIKKNGSFKLIDNINDTIRLIENMICDKYINDIAMHKAVKTIKLYKKLCNAYGIKPNMIIAVATAAVRKADNKDHFLKLLYNSTGIEFKVLSGKEESLYIFKAIIHSLDIPEGIIVDIGGGSTEIIKYKDKCIKNSVCLPIGSVLATEKFLDKNIIFQEKLESLDMHIKKKLSELTWLNEEKNIALIGVGGVIRNLAKIHRKHTNYPLNQTHNYTMDVAEFCDVYNIIKSTDLESRKKIEGISKNRADIIMGGLAILNSIISVIFPKKLVISGFGLREGILFNYLFSSKSIYHCEDVLALSLSNFMHLYEIRQTHANHVCFLSLSLFDQLKELHRFGEDERNLLKIAALLHDIGISISYYEHYKHSFYIILNSRLNGLTHRETVLISAIAAAHSKEDFSTSWQEQFSKILLSKDIEIYDKLSTFLKLAECLDRSEMGIIKSLECQICNDAVRIQTIREGDGELEIFLANEYSNIFKKYFGKLLVIL
ncbi:UNVERIFIED_CONTAM: exopolyphosphatase/guanosine-5'-triphosphate,3'-diphosphate pyrophosphatase [Acetivibrio alkalicellulosi]